MDPVVLLQAADMIYFGHTKSRLSRQEYDKQAVNLEYTTLGSTYLFRRFNLHDLHVHLLCNKAALDHLADMLDSNRQAPKHDTMLSSSIMTMSR